ncbi:MULTISPECIES: type II toxin-antitoxin system death-on-curing family toxin [Clostridium]|jgi:death-on-curing protein|uniref:type II toxin-antitoxin system death-on-curing family toxin n=1 Tax=Clostridium TaxID=1485 RepID=UPI00242E411F|nr:type II toxin-antitoxin system death-on-curing family toxin [Clostridium tyrobutyricum]
MIVFELDEILMLHEKLINRTGGSHGVRDIELLKSALENPFQTFAGEELYPNNISKIAVLTHSVINNHCMIDGNKRLGIALMALLCQLNGIKLGYTQEELIDLGLNIAKGNYTKENIENWIENHIK